MGFPFQQRTDLHQSRWAVLAGWLIMFGVAGCQQASRTDRAMLFFPPPPESPRVQFLTWASGADEVEPRKGKFEDYVLGKQPAEQRVIQKPYGLAVWEGAAYVCDTKGLAVCRLDFRKKSYSVLGVSGSGRLRKPLNIAIDSAGYKFVVDAERKQIVVFGPDDQYVTAFDVPQPCHPVDLALRENELFLLDNDETCQIVVMDRKSGKVIRTFGGPGGEPGQFRIPNSIAISPDDHVYVSDTHNWRIQKLTLQGEPVWAKGSPGYFLGQFGRPRGIRIGPDGLVYVVDGATEIVQVFDPDGNILMRFGGPGDTPGALGLPSSLTIDQSSISYFKEFVHKDFKVDYLLFVASQYGAHLVNVYAFGGFPKGYRLEASQIQSLPSVEVREGIGPVQGDEPLVEPVDPHRTGSKGGDD